MLIKDATHLSDQFINHFKDIVEQVLKESPVVTDEWRKKFEILTVSNSLHFVSTLTRGCYDKKEFDRKFLCEHYRDYHTRWEFKPYLSTVEYHIDENGIMHIDNLFIMIKYNVVAQQIADNLDRLEILKQIFEIDARHEVGHIIDYISLIEGSNYEEYDKNVTKPDDAATDEYYKWKEETFKAFFDRKEDVDNETLRMSTEKYYKLPAEERADILGGVDRAKFISLVYDNMPTTVDINIDVVKSTK